MLLYTDQHLVMMDQMYLYVNASQAGLRNSSLPAFNVKHFYRCSCCNICKGDIVHVAYKQLLMRVPGDKVMAVSML